MGGKACHQIKMTAKSYEKVYRRSNWGQMILDAMKFCLTVKYEHCSEFRDLLKKSVDKYIVYRRTSMSKKQADAWGVKAIGNNYVCPNLLNRLLMELHTNGRLECRLPDGAFDFINFIKTTTE